MTYQIVVSSEEQAVLDAVRRSAGVVLRRIEGMDPADPVQSAAVLPVLKTWIHCEPPNLRAAVISRFATKRAAEYVPGLLSQWKVDSSAQCLWDLNWALAKAVTPKHSELVMAALLEDPRRTERYGLDIVVTLIGLAKTRERAVDILRGVLESGGPVLPQFVENVCRIREPFVDAWIERNLSSRDKSLAALFRRAHVRRNGKAKRLPGVAGRSGPNTHRALVHTEIDIDQIEDSVSTWCSEFGGLPAFPAVEQLLAMDTDQWVRVLDPASQYELWIRLDDYSTLEVVLMRISNARPIE